MEELIKLLEQLGACVASLHQTYARLLEILDTEESLISQYELKNLQDVVAQKDQLVHLAQKTEEKRVSTLKRLCYLIAFDARNTLPSLAEFNLAFEAYMKNIETLVDTETHAQIQNLHAHCREISGALQADFSARIVPRIQQNRIVVAKVRENFRRSLRLFENVSGATNAYDKKGQAQSSLTSSSKNSLLRVQV